MKAKHALGILVFGYCFDFVGGLFKIMHRAGADSVLIVGAFLQIFGALLLLYKIVNYGKFQRLS